MLAGFALAACNAGPAAPTAKVWSSREYLAGHGQPLDFGGFAPAELLALTGEELRFMPDARTQQGGPGLTLFPGVTDSKVAAFAITDIWANHPQPWVEPVWAPLDENGNKVMGVWNVFPVDVDSTFYSPFWRAELLFTPGLTKDTYKSSRDVLNAKVERRSSAIVLCPIVPLRDEGDELHFADDGSGPRDPLTLQPLTLPAKPTRAWVDGHAVGYFDFGADRAAADQQTLQESSAYFFVSAPGERPLPLAAVLPAEAKRHSLVRRVDVVMPASAAPFVPSNRPELKAMLEARAVAVRTVPGALDAFPEFALRVAGSPSCFDEPTFPAGCDWLDTPQRLQAYAPGTLIVQPVQLAIGVVLP